MFIFVCIHTIKQSQSQGIFPTKPKKGSSLPHTILSKKAVGPKMVASDIIDVNKDRSKRPSLSSSKISERKCIEIEVNNVAIAKMKEGWGISLLK